jgi:hypothetical protein
MLRYTVHEAESSLVQQENNGSQRSAFLQASQQMWPPGTLET